MTRSDHFEHRRHAHHVGTPIRHCPDLGRRFEVWSVQADIHRLVDRRVDAAHNIAQLL